jgi:hypothetical protein
MIVWVLVLIMSTGSGTASTTIEFHSRNSCELAQSQTLQSRYTVQAICIPALRKM